MTIWIVPDGDELYVRVGQRADIGVVPRKPSAARRSDLGRRCREGGRFEPAADDLNDAIDAAYRSKYARYSDRTLDRITSSDARATTYRLVPRADTAEENS